MKLYTAKEIKEMFGITNQTLYNWRNNKTIKYTKINKKLFMYELDGLTSKVSNHNKNVVYCRVSNTKQKTDLIRQEEVLRSYCASNGYKIDHCFTDIASGMNENRKGFNSLLELVFNNEVDRIFISYKDRLTRFGYSYFENIFKHFGTEIVVVNSTSDKTFQEELTEDLISIIHHFSMKMYSDRRKQLKELEKTLKD